LAIVIAYLMQKLKLLAAIGQIVSTIRSWYFRLGVVQTWQKILQLRRQKTFREWLLTIFLAEIPRHIFIS
jgi:polyphosphate kinase 2 (PPK2 family)